ncbi:MAG: 5'-nucleotidase C-terminal domain-containing protein [Thermoanaerobaculia bacterium]|nr:5'-nucleotidase C-terminal domain-containing protein [Thermoanaerobaculia bacterium]
MQSIAIPSPPRFRSKQSFHRRFLVILAVGVAAMGSSTPGQCAPTVPNLLEDTADRREVTLLITSGLNGKLVDADDRSLALVAAAVKAAAERERSAGREVVILDAGRTLTPYAESRHEGGTTVMEVLTAAGSQAYAPDPMDFSLGLDALEALGQESSVPVILPSVAAMPSAGSSLTKAAEIKLDRGLTVRIHNIMSEYYMGDLRASGVDTSGPILPVAFGDAQSLDLVIVHTNGDGKSTRSRRLAWELLDEPRGADLLFDPDMSHDLRVNATVDGRPLYLVGRIRDKEWKLTAVEVSLEPTAEGWTVVEVNSTALPIGDDAPDPVLDAQVRASWKKFHQDNDIPLREGAPKDYKELRAFALAAMRESTHAEVAVLNRGGLRPVEQRFLDGDALTKEAVLRMLSIDQRIEVIDLSGRDLVALAKETERRFYEDGTLRQDSLEFVGLTYEVKDRGTELAEVSDVLINGRAVIENDRYSVATNQYLLAGGDNYPLLMEIGSPEGDRVPPELRRDMVLPRLEQVDESFVDLSKKFLWRYGVEELSLLADGVETHHDDEYGESSDSRASAGDSTSIRSRVRMYVNLDRTHWRWENRFKASFGLLETPDETTEIDDDLRFDSSLIFDQPRLLGGSPYISLTLDSEIRRNRNAAGEIRPRQFEETLAGGLSWTTTLWPRIRLGGVVREFPNLDRDRQYGLSAEADFHLPPLDRRPGFEMNLLAEHLSNDDTDQRRAGIDLRVLFPVVKDLAFTPSASYYWLDDSDYPGSATYYRLSVGLAYQWRGKRQSW